NRSNPPPIRLLAHGRPGVGASMSQRTAPRSHGTARPQHLAQYPSPSQQTAHDGGRRGEPRPRAASQPVARSSYTIAHAGRQVRFGPVAFWIAVGTVVIMAGWSITSATYLAFRDDVLRSLIAHQADQQFAYEDRIAE